MPEEKSEQQQFLDEVNQNSDNVDVLEQPLVPEKVTESEEDPEAVPEEIKNRAHRRLEAKLRAEREANIALNARLQAIAESKKEREEEKSDYLKSIERIYGTDSPEAIEASNILKSALKGIKDEAAKEALEAFRKERKEEEDRLREEESRLDSMVEEIEDEYGVTLNPEMKKGYFKLLEKLSPKDSDGNVVAYADPHAVWDEYQTRLKGTKTSSSVAKSLATRSMTQSGASGKSSLQDDAAERFLRENGII